MSADHPQLRADESDGLDEVLRHADTRGWKLIPLIRGQKRPLLKEWQREASADGEKIKGWAEAYPGCGWGFLPGPSGVAVVDIDARSGGFESFNAIRESNGWEPIETPTVTTGGGGQHLYFKTNGKPIKTCIPLPGLEIRSSSGQVILPPSLHPSGTRYEWALDPDEVAMDPLPEFLAELVDSYEPTAPTVEGDIPAGQRNVTLASLAGSMRRRGMSRDSLEAALLAENELKCDPPLDPDEVRQIAASVARYEPAKKVPMIAPQTPDLAVGEFEPLFHRTDLGNAERFFDTHGDEAKFCYELDTWLIWDGRHWASDPGELAERMAHDVVRGMYATAGELKDRSDRKDMAKWAMHSESRGRISAMLDLARAMAPVRLTDLDRGETILNVGNGILDLKTGKLSPHDPDRKLRKLIDVDYRPNAKAPKWQEFLDLITCGVKGLQRYLQRIVGYTFTGRTDEHCFFFPYGVGMNGKTTFVETQRRILGDYAYRIDIESIMQSWKRGSNSPSPYIAGLAGSRFALASEIPESRKLNESLIKDLTGGDSITARFLHSNPVTFEPTHKLWAFGNHKPKIVGTDLGIWRRVRVVPFSVTIRNPRPADDVIGEFMDESEGILAWAVEGSIAWLREGLQTPKIVQDATNEYRDEQDVLQLFLDEECDFHPDHAVNKKDLFEATKAWAETNSETELLHRSQRWLTEQLKIRDVKLGGQGRGRYVGVQLRIPL